MVGDMTAKDIEKKIAKLEKMLADGIGCAACINKSIDGLKKTLERMREKENSQ